jgi:hypothetical protein
MRYRCSHCTETYVVSESISLFPQSFCGKACEVESIVMNNKGNDVFDLLNTIEALEEMPVELVH